MIGVGALLTGAYLRAGYRAPVAVGGAYRVNLPAPGERIDSAAIDGQRILLRLSGPNGEELVIMDVASGRLIGRVAVNSKP